MSFRLFFAEALPYLLAFYLLDGVRRVRPHHRLFAAWWGDRFRMGTGGLRLALVTPASRNFTVPFHWIIPGRTAVFVPRDPRYETDHTDPRFYRRISYEELTELSLVGRSIECRGETVIEFEAPVLAADAYQRLVRLRNLEEDARDAEVRAEVERSLSWDLALARRDEVNRATGALRFAAWVALSLLFGLLPLYAFGRGSAVVSGMALGCLLFIAYSAILVLGLRAERSLSSGPRDWGKLLPMLLSPVTALHAGAEIGRHAFLGFDIAVVGAVLLPEGVRETFLRREIRRCELAALETGPDANVYWESRVDALEKIAVMLGLRAEHLESGPSDVAVGSAYCPLCETEYRSGVAYCADCRVPLRIKGPGASDVV